MRDEPTTERNDRLLKASEAAERLAVSERHVWALAAKGALSPIRLGGRATRFRQSDIEAIIREGVRR